MKNYFLRIGFLVSVVSVALIGNAFAQTPGTSTLKTEKRDREAVARLKMASLTAAERMAWREIQERIDEMSNGEEAKDVPASMHYMDADYKLHTLPEKDTPGGKLINLQQIAVYKKQNLASLYSTSPETRTDIETLSMKGNLATIEVYQYYVRVIRGGDGSPHEARTSVRHRETWIYTDRGWLQKDVVELERGPIYLDGEVYKPST
ncbi:MAG TPA: hypothetical protein VMZ26_13770 [Pyrinomonadaceae bacterium]|nr:hypothetical protein [Pyrinomonadaceae bacterium]